MPWLPGEVQGRSSSMGLTFVLSARLVREALSQALSSNPSALTNRVEERAPCRRASTLHDRGKAVRKRKLP